MRSFASVIVFILLALTGTTQGLKDTSFYVGVVSGVSKAHFIETNAEIEFELKHDSLMELYPLSKSVHPIEIRLYERPSLKRILTCTILYLEDSFYVKKYSINLAIKRSKVKELSCTKYSNADSIFNLLIENGIFSLPEYTYDGFEPDTSRLTLTRKGLLPHIPVWGSTDGSSYTILLKISDVYKRIYFSTREETELLNYPDMDLLRRKKNIVSLLRTGSNISEN